MIVFDTESTGLMRSGLARLSDQPHCIEIAAVAWDGTRVTGEFATLVKPPVPISAEITKITGITSAMVQDAPPAATVLDAFADFVRGHDTWVAHNLAHDVGIVTTELTRLGRQFKFPYPTRHLCTVEATNDMELVDRKMTTLYKALFGVPLKQTHRGIDDATALLTIVQELQSRGRLL